ncbi:branched-chain amino acid ABC transporter permease [Nitratireductor aquimarinus]|uniref:branched-chain amino acid ABC transporter permease n=1 Tax=Nitratireductor aquimarinus TaxID=889300 RepID=UPI0029355B4F|nr:branched-chain amino acid ABC transporter permease [Nitratireductor aquimarinus]MDV2968523.1 branched-chain amino acid ABC transporter permease [Nitratireductor aquimarinus]
MTGFAAYLVFFLIVALTYSIVVMGLNIQWGYTGLFNAGVVGFFAIGAYGTAILVGPDRAHLIGGFGLPFPLAVLGGMALCALAALIVGLATLRLREEYLAIATFGIAISIQLVALNFDSLTGGAQGLVGLPRPLFGLFDSPASYNLFYLGVVAVMAGLVYWALEKAVRSPWGRLLKAVREDETAARSLGRNPARVRLEVFVLGCVLMGLAGGLYVGFIGYVSPLDFLPILTFQIWAMLIVGGSGNNRGAIVGAVGVWALWAMSGLAISRYLPVAYQSQGGAIQVILIGLLIVLTLIFRPRGLIGEAESVSKHAD